MAHIDHGKSTLADRLIESCGGLSKRAMRAQVLDTMELERERGITIKAQTVRLEHRARDGQIYVLNLIDTPGHVDFSYEVNRSLAACEGSLLVVDASQGVEAQTLANVWQALDADHEILPVLNKIDLPAADAAATREQIEDVIGLDASASVEVSAKTGGGIDALLEAIIERLPPPTGDESAPLRALLVDSRYDAYLGVVVLIRVVDGVLRAGDRIRLVNADSVRVVDRVGVFSPAPTECEALRAGEIGFLTASIKRVADAKVGDTITHERRACETPLAGFAPSRPVVFCGMFPLDGADFPRLRDALEKLALNDSGFVHEVESSAALGFGFRCGFLGLLHLEVARERLEREFGIALIATAPSASHRVRLSSGETIELENPAATPDASRIAAFEEPWIEASIVAPDRFVGSAMGLCEERRGRQVSLSSAGGRSVVVYRMPLGEAIFDFHDRLKSATRGYASVDWRPVGYFEGSLAKMSILVNGEAVEALSMIVHRDFAERRGRAICSRLKDLIPRHMFKIPIQAALGGRVIARETISALRKDVTAKCYGGDVSRKRKLLERQKEGKKAMRRFGKVEIPQRAFIAALRMED